MIESLLYRSKSCLGVALGWNRVSAVLATGRTSRIAIKWSRCLETGRSFFEDGDYGHLQATLEELSALLPRQYQNPYIRVQVALPDPVVDQAVFTFDSLPGKRDAAQSLVNWRYAKEFRAGLEDKVCTYQILDRMAGKVSVFCLAVDRRLVECVDQTFRGAGLAVHVLDAAACFQHNYLAGGYKPDDGALICFASDQWTISIWDNKRRLRYFRSFWNDLSADAVSVAAQKIPRILKGYEHQHDGAEISDLYVLGNRGERRQLGELLDGTLSRRIQEPKTPAAPVRGGFAHSPSRSEQPLMVAARR